MKQQVALMRKIIEEYNGKVRYRNENPQPNHQFQQQISHYRWPDAPQQLFQQPQQLQSNPQQVRLQQPQQPQSQPQQVQPQQPQQPRSQPQQMQFQQPQQLRINPNPNLTLT